MVDQRVEVLRLSEWSHASDPAVQRQLLLTRRGLSLLLGSLSVRWSRGGGKKRLRGGLVESKAKQAEGCAGRQHGVVQGRVRW